MMRFILILGSLLFYTCFKAIQLNPTHSYLMFAVGIIYFGIMMLSMFIGKIGDDNFEAPWFMALSWIGSSLIGIWGMFIIVSIPIDVVNLIFALFNHGNGFLNPTISLFIFGGAVLFSLLGFLEVLRGPLIKNVDIPIVDLPESLQGIKIIQISDLHIGSKIRTRYVEDVVKKTNAEKPDFIFITGDLIDAPTEAIKKHLLPMKNFQSTYGTYFVTGNHEYYWQVDAGLSELAKLGFKILMNANEVIDIKGAKILVSGVPDSEGRRLGNHHKPDLIKARATHGETNLNILLVHKPDPYISAEKLGFDIQFSGHTHAGQFFPFSLLVPIVHKYYRGLNRHEKMWLYVNPGTGYWGPANRFGVASEITLATLRKA